MKSLMIGLATFALVAAFVPGALAQSEDMTQIRVAHLSPDAPTVDIWVDGSVALEEVPYEGVSDYLELPAGEHRIQITPTGETEPIVIDATVEFAAGEAYTVAATGLLGEEDLSPVVLQDDLATNEDEAKVRFVHTSPDAPAVDVAVADGPVLFSEIPFRKASAYAGVDPATYDLEVRPAGTTDVALNVPGVTFEAGTNYTIFAIGQLGDDSLAALPVVDAQASSEGMTAASTSTDNGMSTGATAVLIGLAVIGAFIGGRMLFS